MRSWDQFFRSVQQDFKVFLYILSVLCIFRIGFLAIYKTQISAVEDVLYALYYGFRLSLKSAGIIALLSFITTLIVPVRKSEQSRFWLGTVAITILTILFHIRVPYYEVFQSTFGQIIFNAPKDDMVALTITVIQEYSALLRLISAGIVTILLVMLYKKVLATRTVGFPHIQTKTLAHGAKIGVICFLILLAIFVRFGGSLTYAGSIHWENAAVTADSLLNEAILDDVQALYRAYKEYDALQDAGHIALDPQHMRTYAGMLSGKQIQSEALDEYLKKEAAGSENRPRHIFLILAESYAAWPLLPEYAGLNIANGMRDIINSPNAAFTLNFLPAGVGTIAAVNSAVTGLAEVNLYPNYSPESYIKPYSTAIAAQMKKLGYRTYFWYGGYGSWQKIKDFTLAQGFDQFYSAADFPGSGNSWGFEDKYLFQALNTRVDTQRSFHVILTTSNHPPYTIDLEKEGFDPAYVQEGLPESLKKDEDLINRLGHFWYADKYISEFVKGIYKKYPDSLFIITGDHAHRLNIESNPNLFKRYAIPLVIFGQGIEKATLPTGAAGSHINIAPTLIELIAPKGFEYYSVAQSIKRESYGFNHDLWITDRHIGKIKSQTVETLAGSDTNDDVSRLEAYQSAIDSVRAVSWWRISRGSRIE